MALFGNGAIALKPASVKIPGRVAAEQSSIANHLADRGAADSRMASGSRSQPWDEGVELVGGPE